MKQLIIVADGDSWFDYPKILLTGGGLIDHLECVSGLSISNCSHAGDSTLEALGLKKSQRLEKILTGADVLLFSGGGDDFVGDQLCLGINQFEEVGGDISRAINEDWFDAVLTLVVQNLNDLARLRNRVSPNCWIVIHSYDFPCAESMGQGALWDLVGPWIKPSMDWCGWTNPAQQAEIIRTMLVRLKEELVTFATFTSRVKHIDLQATLQTGDWDNEIHANRQGWEKLARVYWAGLQPLTTLLSCSSAQGLPPTKDSHYGGAEA